jgi:hypothetical protein
MAQRNSSVIDRQSGSELKSSESFIAEQEFKEVQNYQAEKLSISIVSLI